MILYCVFKDIWVHFEGKDFLISLTSSKNSLSFLTPRGDKVAKVDMESP